MSQVRGTGKTPPTVAPPTTLLNNAPTEPIRQAPTRCAIDPLVCYAIDGLIEGMERVHFPMEILPVSVEYFKMQLKIEDYEVPDEIWAEFQEYSCEEQAKIIMEIIRSVHLFTALNRLKGGEGPLGSLKGREHLALMLELTGETYVRETLEKVKPLLPKLCLDKGATQGKAGGVDYPSVMNLFYRNRKQFFKVHGLESYAGMYNFLRNISVRLPDWPEALSRPFRDEATAMDAINQIAIHYF